MKKKLYKLLLVLLLCQLQAVAQTADFNYEAAIQPVDSSGFYNIVLTPELNAHLKTDYSDLRIVNDSGRWVPHLVRFPNEEITVAPTVFDRKILEKENTSTHTKVVLEANADELANIVLTIKNTAAKRYCTLSGSDDKTTWFVINDSIEAIPVKNANDKNSNITLLFPPVSYRYFRVLISNNGKAPFNILSAGTEGINNLPGKFFRQQPVENPDPVIFQKDSGKMSYIRIEQTGNYHFDKFSLKASGVNFFNRFAELYIPASVNHSLYSPGKLVQVFHILNNSTLQFKTEASNAKTFYIYIRNQDNLPLQIEEVKTFSSFCVATAYLEKSKQYKLVLDNDIVTVPDYDLKIGDIINKEDLPFAVVDSIVLLKGETVTTGITNDSTTLIWLVISIAAIVLAFFTYRLVTDMNRSKA